MNDSVSQPVACSSQFWTESWQDLLLQELLVYLVLESQLEGFFDIRDEVNTDLVSQVLWHVI